MTASSKSVLRTLMISIALLGLSATAAAADTEFMFQPDVIKLNLEGPRHDGWGLRGWSGAELVATRPVFRSFLGFLKSEELVPNPAPQAAALSEETLREGVERISLSSATVERTGRAGWYGEALDGRMTTTGERFDMYKLTAASAELPLNSYVSVTNAATGETVVVRINDSRPAADGQMLTLSRAAALRISLDVTPDALVRTRYVGQTPPAAKPVQVASR